MISFFIEILFVSFLARVVTALVETAIYCSKEAKKEQAAMALEPNSEEYYKKYLPKN